MNLILRLACLAAFVLALAHLGGLMPAGWFSRAPMIAAILLGLHALELLLFFRHVRLYRGPLAVSVVLSSNRRAWKSAAGSVVVPVRWR